MLTPNSPFINEGKNLLIEEFGKEYGAYFSILELISIGKTARTEIQVIQDGCLKDFSIRFLPKQETIM